MTTIITGNGIQVGTDLSTGASVIDKIGNVRSLPINTQSVAYMLASTDAGKCIRTNFGGVTIPANVFGEGQVFTIYNNSASSTTITQGFGVTLRQDGTANIGTRTLAQRGRCQVLCLGADEFVLSGTGLS